MTMLKGRSLLFYLFLLLAAVLIGGSVGFFLYSVWDLPEVQTLEEYKPSITSRVYSDNNRLLAEFLWKTGPPWRSITCRST